MDSPADRFVTALEIAHAGDEADDTVHAEAKVALERARTTRDAQVLASLAPATLAAYAWDWRGFVLWCARHAVVDPSLVPLPATYATLSTWVGALDALRPSSLRRKLAAVRLVHRWAAEPLVDAEIPLTLAAVKGHVRRHAGVPPRQVRAATGDLVWRLADACDSSTSAGLRNRALILVDFDAALRSAELVGLDHGHLAWSADGVALTLPRSKADQRGQGAVVSVHARIDSPWCPVAALERWIESSGRSTGAVFVAAAARRRAWRGARRAALPTRGRPDCTRGGRTRRAREQRSQRVLQPQPPTRPDHDRARRRRRRRRRHAPRPARDRAVDASLSGGHRRGRATAARGDRVFG